MYPLWNRPYTHTANAYIIYELNSIFSLHTQFFSACLGSTEKFMALNINKCLEQRWRAWNWREIQAHISQLWRWITIIVHSTNAMRLEIYFKCLSIRTFPPNTNRNALAKTTCTHLSFEINVIKCCCYHTHITPSCAYELNIPFRWTHGAIHSIDFESMAGSQQERIMSSTILSSLDERIRAVEWT